jgi:hypothetical protein
MKSQSGKTRSERVEKCLAGARSHQTIFCDWAVQITGKPRTKRLAHAIPPEKLTENLMKTGGHGWL